MGAAEAVAEEVIVDGAGVGGAGGSDFFAASANNQSVKVGSYSLVPMTVVQTLTPQKLEKEEDMAYDLAVQPLFDLKKG